MTKAKQLSLRKGTKVPDHIAIVLDGNRRWARSRGLATSEGHRAGFKAVENIARASRQLGVHTLTAWALSTENWMERKERKMILILARKALALIQKEAEKEGVRFIHIGRKDRLPSDIIKTIAKLEKATLNNKKHVVNLALDYGGVDEVVRATRKIVKDKIEANKIDEKLLTSYLDTGDQPYPFVDLFIRTSGEQRTSGLMPIQTHYAEFYWERDHLPDFNVEKLKEAIIDYSCRRRRYGGEDTEKHFKFKPEVAANLEVAWWRLSKVPQGTKFSEFVIEYLIEQYGLSKTHAKKAAKYMTWAILSGDKKEWKKARKHMKSFYVLVRDHLKLAFEPEIVASLKVKLWQDVGDKQDVRRAGEIEVTARKLYAEEYRISDFQATKAAHLKVMAQIERNLAHSSGDEVHWNRAEDYLQKHYRALKERVA